MLQSSQDSTIDVDLDLARRESAENPVYYVQYAHARIASVLRKAGDDRVDEALASSGDGLQLDPAERELVKKLLAFPAEAAAAAAWPGRGLPRGAPATPPPPSASSSRSCWRSRPRRPRRPSVGRRTGPRS